MQTISNTTTQASQLSSRMTYEEVVRLLGRTPCTAYDEYIASDLGEPTMGHGLITCEWKNDDSDCHPVTVQFEPDQMRVTGWSDGRTRVGAGLFTQPFGPPFSETALSKIRRRLNQ